MLKPGDRVQLTRRARTRMFWARIQYGNGTVGGWAFRKHVQEFRRCVGLIDSVERFGQVDVRWQPSNLRYAYDVKDLERV